MYISGNLLDFSFFPLKGRHTGDKGLNLLGSFLNYILIFIYDTSLDLSVLLGDRIEEDLLICVLVVCQESPYMYDKGQFITWVKMDDTSKFTVLLHSTVVLYF